MGMSEDKFQQANANESSYFNRPYRDIRANPDNYAFLDFTNQQVAQNQLAANQEAIGRMTSAEGETRAGLDAFAASANQAAAQQAMRNTRGVGEAFGAMGAVGSGAAAEAYAQGALTPYYQAQQSIAQMENQAGMQRAGIRQNAAQLMTQQAADFADRFSAIAAPTIDIGLSEMERRQATGASS